jgi:quinol monooxygenase YgiN
MENLKSVLVVVKAHAKPGMRDALIAGFKRSQAASPAWPGCRQFDITIAPERDDLVIVIERWDSAAQHGALFRQIVSDEGFKRFRELLSADLAPRYLELQC